jgi:hypothetical protein
VGKINEADVYVVTDTAFLPFAYTELLDPLQKQNLERSYAEIRKWLNSNSFYFSFHYDITSSVQKQKYLAEKQSDPKQEERWATADIRFFWNRNVQNYFIKNSLHDWIIPMLNGFIEKTSCSIRGNSVDLILISRLSCLRYLF